MICQCLIYCFGMQHFDCSNLKFLDMSLLTTDNIFLMSMSSTLNQMTTDEIYELWKTCYCCFSWGKSKINNNIDIVVTLLLGQEKEDGWVRMRERVRERERVKERAFPWVPVTIPTFVPGKNPYQAQVPCRYSEPASEAWYPGQQCQEGKHEGERSDCAMHTTMCIVQLLPHPLTMDVPPHLVTPSLGCHHHCPWDTCPAEVLLSSGSLSLSVHICAL